MTACPRASRSRSWRDMTFKTAAKYVFIGLFFPLILLGCFINLIVRELNKA